MSIASHDSMSEAVDEPVSPAVFPSHRPTLEQLYTQDQLAGHARLMAETQVVAADPRVSKPLLPRLEESAEQLEQAYQFLSATARADPQPVAAEDWLRDNYHVVQDQVREVRRDLPRRFYIELPKLASGEFTGFPRIYPIACELIAHTAGRLDLETLVEFATAYQQVAPLAIGEIWAIPIMVRLALVEELRRLSDGVVAARRSRERARAWSSAATASPRDLDALLRGQADEDGRLSAAFVVELLQWLRDQPPSATPAWLALQRALKRKTTLRKRCCGSSTSAKPRCSWRWATSSPACG